MCQLDKWLVTLGKSSSKFFVLGDKFEGGPAQELNPPEPSNLPESLQFYKLRPALDRSAGPATESLPPSNEGSKLSDAEWKEVLDRFMKE
jgi:hypothetical protein